MTLARVAFELTNRCNLHCVHCLRDGNSSPTDLPVSLIRKVLTQARDRYGVRVTAFTGGEPLLHPQIGEIFSLSHEMDLTFSLVTNGLLVPKLIGLFRDPAVKPRLTTVCLSFEGPDAASHEAIRGQGTFKKVMAALLALKAEGVPVDIKLTISKPIIGRLEAAILEFCHLGVAGIELSPLLPTPDNVAAGILPDPAEARQAVDAAVRLASELKTKIHVTSGQYLEQSFFTCSALSMIDLYVDSRGRLCVCCMLPGLRGRDPDQPERDAVADLFTTDLWDAHKKLIAVIAALQRDRVDKIAKGLLTETDHFMCLSCAKHFGKFDWIQDFPASPWNDGPSAKEVKNE